MEHHNDLPADVANALLNAKRNVITASGMLVGYGFRIRDDEGPFRLASPEPLTAEQARAVGEACEWWEFQSAGNPKYFVRSGDKRAMDHFTSLGKWKSLTTLDIGSAAGGPWYIRPPGDAERQHAARHKPVTFGLKAARAAYERDARLMVFTMGHTWAYWGSSVPHSHTEWSLQDAPTAAQVSAIVKAEPERLCAVNSEGIVRLWAVSMGRWAGPDYALSDYCPDGAPGASWRIAIRPDYARALAGVQSPERVRHTEPELPRTTDLLSEAAAHAEAGGVVEDVDGDCFRLRDGVWHLFHRVQGWRPSSPSGEVFRLGTYTLHPADHLEPVPKVEPKSGAELRRWMVKNPGREVTFANGVLAKWDATACRFYTRFPRSDSWEDCIGTEGPCTPANGTWESGDE